MPKHRLLGPQILLIFFFFFEEMQCEAGVIEASKCEKKAEANCENLSIKCFCNPKTSEKWKESIRFDELAENF